MCVCARVRLLACQWEKHGCRELHVWFWLATMVARRVVCLFVGVVARCFTGSALFCWERAAPSALARSSALRTPLWLCACRRRSL